MDPLVSAIIPTYNHATYVIEAVESVLAQTHKNIEIIVVDDGSSDNTRDVLAPYMPRIRYIYQQNQGLSAARNAGIRNAGGSYVAFLDADDVWLPEKISSQVADIVRHDRCGLITCGCYFCDEDLKVVSQVLPPSCPDKDAFMKAMVRKNVVGGGSVALVRKECFDRVGYFDSGLSASEDWDMWIRIGRHYEVRFIDRPLMKRRDVRSSMSAAINSDRMLKNELLVLRNAFSCGPYKYDMILKARAYSYRYLHCALAYRSTGQTGKMRNQIFKALLLFPPALFSKQYFSLLLCAVLGDKLTAILKSPQYRAGN